MARLRNDKRVSGTTTTIIVFIECLSSKLVHTFTSTMASPNRETIPLSSLSLFVSKRSSPFATDNKT